MPQEQEPSRTLEIVSDSLADTITPTVTAVLAAAAVATRNPELGFLSVPLGAITGALSKQGALLVIDTLRDSAGRVARLLDEIEARTGVPFDQFQAAHVTNDPKRRLLNSIVADATDATTAWKIQLLAQAFLRGAADEAHIDETLYFVRRVKMLDSGHARVLAVLTTHHLRGISRMSYAEVSAADPGIGLATVLLGSDLVKLGFVAEVSGQAELAVTPTTVGLAIAKWLQDIVVTEEPSQGPPATP